MYAVWFSTEREGIWYFRMESFIVIVTEMLLLLSFLWVLPSDENVKVKEDGRQQLGSWALAMEVKR